MASPSKVAFATFATYAPHAFTTRWTYTVPAGRFAIVEHLRLGYSRQTAAGPAALMQTDIRYTPAGGAAQFLAVFISTPVALTDRDSNVWGPQMRLLPGDVLSARTADTSTGGTIDFFSSLNGTEYDV